MQTHHSNPIHSTDKFMRMAMQQSYACPGGGENLGATQESQQVNRLRTQLFLAARLLRD